MICDKPADQLAREEVERNTLERAAIAVEAREGNSVYRQAWKIAARIIAVFDHKAIAKLARFRDTPPQNVIAVAPAQQVYDAYEDRMVPATRSAAGPRPAHCVCCPAPVIGYVGSDWLCEQHMFPDDLSTGLATG
jgi:hypothetical protein